MASFGRLTIAGITGNNENTIALANINVDFSLLKIVPPKEFFAVGNSLSNCRKQEAEEGHIHQTARKLGAIFEPILPPTPRLIQNYGTRASQIAQSVISTNPKAEGLFKKQAGIDGTSIWAAATSSSGALQVHLLACMLARIWEQTDAISIWEEILDGRKSEIKETLQEDGNMSLAACSSYLASLQTITRKQLGEWDDSARAWLRAADRSPVVIVRQNQLNQIVSNTRNMVNSRPSLYDSVLETWKTALTGAERLLIGSPQEMQTGELLLGLNAWHIYPDINLLGDPDILAEFSDSLVPKGGILTIGLVRSSESSLSAGLHWSLPLAHLRYYGDPIPRTGKLNGVQNRISLPEFMQTILGIVIKLWEVNDSIIEEALRWIILLQNAISSATCYLAEAHKSYDKSNWLALLSQAASNFLESKGDQRLLNKRLFNAGRLHGSKALLGECMAPYFGLSQTLSIFYLLKTQEAKIKFLRALIQRNASIKDHLIIRYIQKETGREEYASAFPDLSGRAAKRTYDGNIRQHGGGYKRWIYRHSKKLETPEKLDAENPIKAADTFMGFVEDKPGEVRPILTDHGDPLAPSIPELPTPEENHHESRAQVLENLGEAVLAIEDEPFETLEMNGDIRVVWGISDEMTDDMTAEEKWHWDPFYGEVKHFSLLFGDPTDVALFLRMSEAEPRIPEQMDFHILSDLTQSSDLDLDLLPIVFFDAVQSSSAQCARSLRAIATMHQLYESLPGATLAIKILESRISLYNADWLPSGQSDTHVSSHSDLNKKPKKDELDDEEQQRSRNERSFGSPDQFEQAFEGVSHVFNIPSRERFERFRNGVGRLRNSFQASFMNPFELSVAQAFSCVLLFDSGVFDIPPSHMNDTMAISSGDSLFIAAPLLSDPAENRYTSQKIKHIMGNIGRAGTALLQAPVNPKIRKIGVEQWSFISGDDWDGQRRDAFRDTSLHLWFTGSSLPIDRKSKTLGEKDVELYMLESVISVHGRGTIGCGEWMADLDILKSLRNPELQFQTLYQSPTVDTPKQVVLHKEQQSSTLEEYVENFDSEQYLHGSDSGSPISENVKPDVTKAPEKNQICPAHNDSSYHGTKLKLTAIENWIELLETPTKSSIFLGEGNWQARQAATAISIARGRRTCILSESTCWTCVTEQYPEVLDNNQAVIFIA